MFHYIIKFYIKVFESESLHFITINVYFKNYGMQCKINLKNR